MVAARSKQDVDILWELVKRVGSLETQVRDVHERVSRANHYTRRYMLSTIKRLRVEKQGLQNYIKELEKFNKLPSSQR